MADETPVLDTLADITAASVGHNLLAPRELRLAALIAVDAPPASSLANAGAARESGVTGDDIQVVMIGVAPVVGTARVVAAGGNILRGAGPGDRRGRRRARRRERRRAVAVPKPERSVGRSRGQ